MAGLKRIPVLGNQVDKLPTASAQQLIGQAQLALRLLDWLLTELDFFVQIDEVRSWVWDVANDYRVTVTALDGTTSELPAHAALVMHLAGADISGPCVQAFGWTPARATVAVAGLDVGHFRVARESYVNGHLDTVELSSPASRVEWSTGIEPGDSELVGPDLSTG